MPSLSRASAVFCVPLSDRYDTADMAREFDLPVILVVGLRLGCINHALLTAQAIAAKGLRLAGWGGKYGRYADAVSARKHRSA